jgi:hypothetical protein
LGEEGSGRRKQQPKLFKATPLLARNVLQRCGFVAVEACTEKLHHRFVAGELGQ